MKWVTRERPKIDRIACPWLIARFIDQQPEFLYVPTGDVFKVAEDTGAIPYDIPDAELSHVGECFASKYWGNSSHDIFRPCPDRCAGLHSPTT